MDLSTEFISIRNSLNAKQSGERMMLGSFPNRPLCLRIPQTQLISSFIVPCKRIATNFLNYCCKNTITSVVCMTHDIALHYMKPNALMTNMEIRKFFISIGRQLKIVRNSRKISDEQFAKEMGITSEQLIKIDAGEVWVEPEFYKKAAEIFKMNTRVFIDSISSYELPGVLARHRDLILASLDEKQLVNFGQYHRECKNAARQGNFQEERKQA